MVDLAFLAKALAQSEQAAQASNPYGTTNEVLNSIQWNPNDFSTGENLAGGAVKGLLSGFFGGLGDNYVAGQKAQSMDLLGSLARGKEIARPDDMDLSVFAPLEQAGGLFALQQDLENEQLAKQSSVKQAEAITSELAKRGLFITPKGERLQLFNPLQEKADEAAATEKGKIKGANEAWGGDVSQNPDSPQYKANQNIAKEEDAARTEIAKMPSVSQFNSMQKSLPLVRGFKDADTKSSDVGFVYNYIKALDEGAVRGEEINMAAASNPLVQKWSSQLQGAMTGQSELTPALKNTMFRELQAAQKNVYAQALLDAQKRYNIAESRGVKEFGKVLNFDPNLSFEEEAPPSPSTKTKVKASDLIAQGYTQGPSGWIPPVRTGSTPRG